MNKDEYKVMAIILKYVGLLVYGQMLNAGVIVVLKHFDPSVTYDSWYTNIVFFSWTTICINCGYLEYIKSCK